MSSNYPPGMTARDYDHVEGRDLHELVCPDCNGEMEKGIKVDTYWCTHCHKLFIYYCGELHQLTS